MRILVVEDEKLLCDGIAEDLELEKYTVERCYDGAEAYDLLLSESFDLLILDINLPDGNGLDLLRALRRESEVPVILLTANDLETDIVAGLELGADDYITKPFSLAVLRARVNTQLRRTAAPQAERVQLDGFTFDFGRMEFSRNGVPVELSKTEQKLLRLLVEHRGQTLTRAALVDRIWTDGAEYVDENALSVTVKRLRDKLENGLLERISDCMVNGDVENRLPNTSNIAFKNVEGEAILLMLDRLGICASSGSACTSGSLEPSHVLRAMGVPFNYAHGSVRLSLSRYTTEEDVDYVIENFPGVIETLRAISPFKN